MPTSRRFRLLNGAQLRLLLFVMGGCALLFANSLYLWLLEPARQALGIREELSGFHQAMLLGHVLLGLVLFVAALVFTFWHLPRAIKRRTPGAVPTGLVTITVATFLLVTGLFLISEANSLQNRWAFVGHQIAALALPLAYLTHRFQSKDPITWASVGRGSVMVIALFALMGAAHHLTSDGPLPERPAEDRRPPAPAAWTAVGMNDPFVPFVATGDVPVDRPFWPSGVTLDHGDYAAADAIHLGERPEPQRLAKEVAEKGFFSSEVIGAGDCQSCHPDTVAQWAQSVHRFASFNNVWYARAVELTRERQGKRAAQWCAGCHDPALLVAGLFPEDFDPASAEAQTGLSCLACHAMETMHSNVGNAAYELRADPDSPYLFARSAGGLGRYLHEQLIKAKPDRHRQRMLKDFHRESEFCSTCHKVHLDIPVNGYRWLRGQNEYDAWHNSGFAHNNPTTWYEPPAPKSCQDCHMRPEEAPLGDLAAADGMVRSHRFHAVNTGVHHTRGDEDAIARIARERENSLRLDVFALRREDGTPIYFLDHERPTLKPGERVQLEIVVRNRGIGHMWPGGTIDSNEAWIEVKVFLDDELVAISGALDQDRKVDPGARFYQGVFVDEKGQRITMRNAPEIRAPVYVNVIAPSNSDLGRYALELPAEREGTLRIEAAVRWRKFNRAYVEFVFPDPTERPELPITTVASDSVTLGVGRPAPGAPKEATRDWTRLNDYAIAQTRDGNTRAAAEAFEAVVALAPELVDPRRNLARAHLLERNLPKARQRLMEALERLDALPEDARIRQEARTAYFFGRLLEEEGRLEEAEQAYLRCLETYSGSRDAWEHLALVRWGKGDFEGTIAAALEVLAIDPEHRQAHYRRMLAYRALAERETDPVRKEGLAFAADEARKAFEKYKIDENAQTWTLGYRQTHPEDNEMAQSVHVHRLKAPAR